MLKKLILNAVNVAINKAIEENKLGQMTSDCEFHLVVETPKNYDFGDFAVNVSQLARHAKLAPPMIAQTIKDFISFNDAEINVVAGFINFKLGPSHLFNILSEIANETSNYGKGMQKASKILLEYVSANPTGPFHIGHGRWAAMGSALASLLEFAGYEVYQEFYINDAGSQIDNLARSMYLRLHQQNGVDIDFPTSDEEIKKYYPGDYLIPAAKAFMQENKGFYAENSSVISYDELPQEQKNIIKDFTKAYMLASQKSLLERLNVRFDNFFSETSLYKQGLVEDIVKRMKSKGLTYEEDGALWFRTTDFGDEKDRVLIKNDGKYTYLTPDIAYHINKLERGYDKLINIWGADHHGYICRMRAALQGLGYNADAMEVLLGQLVNLKIDGEAVRMGKRKKMVTLEDLVDEVGVDATRYWMIFRDINTTLDFDVELAKSKTDENPVFYLQYAHARCCSILRNALGEKLDTVENKIKEAALSDAELSDYTKKYASGDYSELEVLTKTDAQSVESAKRLILKMEEFKSVIEVAAQARAPYVICKYLQELAAQFHQFYAVSRVISDDKELTKARLSVASSFKTVLATGLSLLGISAPERM